MKTSDVGGPLVYRTAPEVEESYNNVLVNSIVDRCDARAFLVCHGTNALGGIQRGFSVIYIGLAYCVVYSSQS